MREYLSLQDRLARGWNNWNTWSMLSHVLMPEALELNLALRDNVDGVYLSRALMRRADRSAAEELEPGTRSIDGSYSSVLLHFRGSEILFESGLVEGDLVVLASPVKVPPYAPTLLIQAGFLWNRPGAVSRDGSFLKAIIGGANFVVHLEGDLVEELNSPAATPYLAARLSGPIALSVGKRRTIEEVRSSLEKNRIRMDEDRDEDSDLADCREGLRAVMAWDTIYDPAKRRVVSPVSRYWSAELHGGYVLFCWDSYFAATLASAAARSHGQESARDLAYANAVEITKEIRPEGFVAIMNCPIPRGTDRSQPPVGALTVLGLYNRYGDRWLLEAVFDELYRWNAWWLDHRQVGPGLLAWGYNPGFTSTIAALESGLDNSPMYDDAPFDHERLIMKFADVGLTSLHAMDSRLLARVARILGRGAEARILDGRARLCEAGLDTLWDEASGAYLNRNMETGVPSRRLSPTLFYPLLTEAVPAGRAERMIREHFYNPDEFYGEWILPSIARNDPSYKDQDYWRGRIWAPLNWLVYLAFRKYGQTEAARDLAEKSKRLFLKEWRGRRHVHENYNADTGEGCPDGKNENGSDPFYHWGALLAMIALVDAGAADFDPWRS